MQRACHAAMLLPAARWLNRAAEATAAALKPQRQRLPTPRLSKAASLPSPSQLQLRLQPTCQSCRPATDADRQRRPVCAALRHMRHPRQHSGFLPRRQLHRRLFNAHQNRGLHSDGFRHRSRRGDLGAGVAGGRRGGCCPLLLLAAGSWLCCHCCHCRCCCCRCRCAAAAAPAAAGGAAAAVAAAVQLL